MSSGLKRAQAPLALALLLGAAGVAAAGEGTAPVRVTSFLLEHKGVDDQLLPPVMRALGDGLRRNPRLEMKELDTRLADFAQETPQDAIDAARQTFKEGEEALGRLDFAVAKTKLSSAIDQLGRVLPYIKKQELADAMMALAHTQLQAGEVREGKATLTRLLTWRSDFKLDTNKYPPDVLIAFEESRKEVARAKRGSLEIRSEPPAAQVFVDGRYVGVTPTFAEGLAAGEHWITFKRDGYHKAVTPGLVSTRKQQVINVTLERSAKYLLVEQALAAVEKSLGQDTLDPSADNLKEVLYIDHAVFARARPVSGRPASMQLDLYVYDLRTRRRLAHTYQIPSEGLSEKDMSGLASALYLNVRYVAEVEAPPEAPPPKPYERRPLLKTWWFWTLTGAVAIGAAVAIGVGVSALPKDCGGGNFCPTLTF